MSSYQDQLTALGLPQEVVNRYLLANDVQAFRNRDSAAYGRIYESEQIADAAPTTGTYYGD